MTKSREAPSGQPVGNAISRQTSVQVICSTGNKRWNFRKANWDKFSASAEKSTPIIPQYGIPVDEA